MLVALKNIPAQYKRYLACEFATLAVMAKSYVALRLLRHRVIGTVSL